MQRWWDLSWHHYTGVRFWGSCSPVKQWICLRDYPEPGYGEEVGMSYRVVFTDLRMLVWECSKSISGGSTHKLIMVRCHEKESGWWLSEVAGRSVRMKRVLILNCNQWDVVRDFAESSVSAVQGSRGRAGGCLEWSWRGRFPESKRKQFICWTQGMEWEHRSGSWKDVQERKITLHWVLYERGATKSNLTFK